MIVKCGISYERQNAPTSRGCQGQAFVAGLSSVPRRFPWDKRVKVRNHHIRLPSVVLGVPQIICGRRNWSRRREWVWNNHPSRRGYAERDCRAQRRDASGIGSGREGGWELFCLILPRFTNPASRSPSLLGLWMNFHQREHADEAWVQDCQSAYY